MATSSALEIRNNDFEKGLLTENHGKITLEDFELLKVLGTGAYGKVFLVRRKNGKDKEKLFAMKVLKKSAVVAKAKTTEHTITERHVLEAVRRCPFIVTMHYAFQTDAKLHIIMDYVSGGELFTHLYNREHFNEEEAKFYTAEVAIALDFLHKLGIIYRDIKLENILLDKDGHIVLTDFGLSKEFTPQESDGRAYSFCGTIEYMAPEIVKGGKVGHGMAVDWWSLGVLFYELITGASPFTVEGERNTQAEISVRILHNPPPLPRTISRCSQDFIIRLLQKEPSKRLGGGPRGLQEIKEHAIFQNLDWDTLAQKKVDPPFKPVVKNDTDTSNFSEEFTKMMPIDSPAIIPKNAEKVFRGYSFVAPSVIFGNNTIADDIFSSDTDNYQNRPGNASLIYASLFESSSFHKQYMLSNEILGKGSFSICKKCVDRHTNEEYAVKIMTRRMDHSLELQSLKLCQSHPNVVQIHEIHEDELHVYVVMEYLRGGELLDRIKKKKNFSEIEASKLMRKLVSVVNFMHTNGVVHRDLKPENLLFTNDSETAELKLVDFGFAKIIGSQPLQTPCFTLSYAAPEVLRNATGETMASYDESVDIWSLGVILYTMLSGKVPFQPKKYTHQAAYAIMKNIMSGDVSFSGDEWLGVSASAKHLIQGLLKVDASKRMTLHDIEAHDWLSGRVDMPTTPLMTPIFLDSSGNLVGKAFQVAFNAYHKARTVTLMDVASAPLAKRRKLKHSSHDRTPSTGSSSSEENRKERVNSNEEKEKSSNKRKRQTTPTSDVEGQCETKRAKSEASLMSRLQTSRAGMKLPLTKTYDVKKLPGVCDPRLKQIASNQAVVRPVFRKQEQTMPIAKPLGNYTTLHAPALSHNPHVTLPSSSQVTVCTAMHAHAATYPPSMPPLKVLPYELLKSSATTLTRNVVRGQIPSIERRVGMPDSSHVINPPSGYVNNITIKKDPNDSIFYRTDACQQDMYNQYATVQYTSPLSMPWVDTNFPAPSLEVQRMTWVQDMQNNNESNTLSIQGTDNFKQTSSLDPT